MINIEVSDQIKNVCPDFTGAAVFATVKNTPYDEGLWALIDEFSKEYKSTHQMEDVKKNKAIDATRQTYKRLGKDPNRYRPSSEALCRRILRDLPLYKIDTLVDLVNLVSLKTGYSIGGFDMDKIEGDSLVLGVGQEEEPYEGIGRGLLNIEGLPVYRDRVGGIGTPTSDHERTKIDLSTTHFLAIINGYSGKDGLQEAVEYMNMLLENFLNAREMECFYFS